MACITLVMTGKNQCNKIAKSLKGKKKCIKISEDLTSHVSVKFNKLKMAILQKQSKDQCIFHHNPNTNSLQTMREQFSTLYGKTKPKQNKNLDS